MTTPSSSNDYAVDGNTTLDDVTWNAVFGSLGARIRALETATADFQNAVSDAAIATAQGLLSDAVAPQLATLQTSLDDFTAELALAEDRLQALQTGGVAASNVSVGAIEGLDATNAQAAIAELLAGLAAEVTARTDAIAAIKPVKFTAVSANTTLVAGSAYRIRATAITLTLPAAPANGDTVRLTDGGVLSAAATATVARNGKTIMGLAEDLTLDTAGLDVLLWYNGTDWRLAL